MTTVANADVALVTVGVDTHLDEHVAVASENIVFHGLERPGD